MQQVFGIACHRGIIQMWNIASATIRQMTLSFRVRDFPLMMSSFLRIRPIKRRSSIRLANYEIMKLSEPNQEQMFSWSLMMLLLSCLSPIFCELALLLHSMPFLILKKNVDEQQLSFIGQGREWDINICAWHRLSIVSANKTNLTSQQELQWSFWGKRIHFFV